MFHSCLAWLRGRYVLDALLGAAGGPLAYYLGARLGAIAFPDPPGLGLAIVAAAWALAVPLLLRLSWWIVPALPPASTA
jgi:hypothetical protein